jgi:hypothetical protein
VGKGYPSFFTQSNRLWETRNLVEHALFRQMRIRIQLSTESTLASVPMKVAMIRVDSEETDNVIS